MGFTGTLLEPRLSNPVCQPLNCRQRSVYFLCFFDSEESFLVLTEFPCVVLWRPEALDCRVPIPPEAWSWLTRNPPSVGLEPRTSCIRDRILNH